MIESISRRGLVSGATGMVAGALVAGAGARIASAAEAGAGNVAQAEAGAPGERRVVTGSATGRMGEIMVKVTLSGTTIEAVDVVKHDETLTIAASALARIPQLVVRNQSLDLDAVAGATVTSYGVIFAIEDALAQAGLTRSDLANTGADQGLLHEEPIAADVIVVGGGLAGLTCAARLVDLGKTVAVFEESAHLGGSAPMAAGWISGAGTKIEADCGIEDSAEQYYAYMEELAAHYGGVIDYPEVVRAFCENNGPAVDWLDEYARIDLGNRQGNNGLYDTPDVPRVLKANGCGASVVVPLIGSLQPAVRDGRASLVLEARVTRILTDADGGAARGVEVTYADGTIAEYEAGAVVVATGGYGHDCTGMKEAGNYVNVASCNPSTAHGHGRELLREVGAQFVLDEANASYGAAVQNLGDEARYQANIFAPGMVWVDSCGARVADESNWLNSFHAWDEAPENYVWVLFSEAQGMTRPLVRTSYHEGEVSPYESWELFDRFEGEQTFRGMNAEELAESAGIDPAGLAATIERVNGFVDAGADDDFGNPAIQRLEGELYAIKTVPYMLMTAGGVKVTPEAQVVGEDDEPIACLYAAGEVLGIRQYAAYTRAGNGLGGAITWGYTAANSVAAAL